ncbi:putative DNA-binding protein [Paraliobacillus sp. PM-2]|uniref:putative DNA-binding protein n=1 Tax=Paraliobacillus sp. PM-2 TaxID=1462524 RepID=UPI00061CD8B8|nr:putative DNA-binding protein [Paraliobacillus sp. PM-2]CQR47724.1 putative DNA-binding protein [Paraliobacillus sp. PM-2]
MLEKTTRINFLFDFYQSLLTPKQRNYMEMYYLEDYSLGEISESFHVSRQAVYDNIRRTETMLEDYEKKLQLYEKFIARQKIVDQLTNELQDHAKAKKLVKILKELE